MIGADFMSARDAGRDKPYPYKCTSPYAFSHSPNLAP